MMRPVKIAISDVMCTKNMFEIVDFLLTITYFVRLRIITYYTGFIANYNVLYRIHCQFSISIYFLLETV